MDTLATVADVAAEDVDRFLGLKRSRVYDYLGGAQPRQRKSRPKK